MTGTVMEGEAAAAIVGGEGFHTAAQMEAIVTVDRPVLVLAGAGTGKTSLLATKYNRIEARHGRGSVAAITFTKKAASELRHRISDQALAEGREPDPDALIGTFHNVAVSIIRRAHAAGIVDRRPRIADDKDMNHYAATALAGAEEDPGRTGSGSDRARAVQAANRSVIESIERIKRSGHVPVEAGYEDTGHAVHAHVPGLPTAGSRQHAVALRYCELMAARNQCDFADLILYATRLLRTGRDGIVPRLVAVLVDEYQDTDKAQNDMVVALTGDYHVTCVGDDDQSVYAWRGARIENLLEFPRNHPDALTVTLDVNYRCPADLLEHALRLVSRNGAEGRRVAKSVTAARPGPPRPSITLHDIHVDHSGTRRSALDQMKRIDIPAYVASIVSGLTAAGRAPSDIVCLARSNAEVDALEEVLEDAGIETRIANPNAIASREARRLTAWMRLIVDPDEIAAAATVTDSPAGDRAFQDVVAGARRDGVAVMDRIAATAAEGRFKTARFAQAGARYAAIDAMRRTAAPIDVVEAICRQEVATMSDDGDPRNQRRVANFWSIYNGLVVMLDDAETIEDAIECMQTRLSEDDLVEEARQVVELSTIHSIKGRQKRVVVLSSFIDGIFPSMGDLAKGSATKLAEERRLAYVAMTRARDELHVVVANDRPGTFATEAGLSSLRALAR